MANMASNRSPSPLSSRNCRISGPNSATRGSFNGRPNALTNPISSNPPTPANTPTATDHTKRNSISRKSTSSLFQDGKENHKDALRSPAKIGSKNFMAPTISAASKFTPSPRKKILGDKNDVTRASIQFFDKDPEFRSEKPSFEQAPKPNDDSYESKAVEQEIVGENAADHEVTLSSTDESTEMLSGCTEDSDVVSIRPVCCSPITSPIVAPLDSDPNLPPYDPKNNFLSPRPRFLRYKPNPRIEKILNKEGSDDYGEDDVSRLEESFNMSENSDTEVEEQEQESESGDSVHGSSEDLSEKVSEEEQLDLKVEKPSKGRFFTRSKTVSFVFLMFLVACYSVSVTDFPPMDLPIYKDVGISEIYHESLKFAGFAKESFDVLVEDLKIRLIDFISYISYQKSQLFPTHKVSTTISFFNLTTSPVQEEFVFNRHIGTDYIQEIQEYEEEMRDEPELIEEVEVEEVFVEMEVDDDIDAADEVVNEQLNEVQSDDDGFVETNSDLDDGSMSKSEAIYETRSEPEANDLEITSDVKDSNAVSENMSTFSTKSLERICLGGIPMVIIAVCTIIYMYKRKSNAKKPAAIRVADKSTCEESCSSSVGNEHKKKTSNNKRESLAFSSSDFSMGTSYGSFTTLERIPIKNKDEVILTPIRRSSRLLKNHVS